jgi:hypothetical protein
MESERAERDQMCTIARGSRLASLGVPGPHCRYSIQPCISRGGNCRLQVTLSGPGSQAFESEAGEHLAPAWKPVWQLLSNACMLPRLAGWLAKACLSLPQGEANSGFWERQEAPHDEASRL